MSTVALVPIAEYLRRTEKPNCEYRDGGLYPKAMPTSLHAWMQSLLILLLTGRGKLAWAELTLRVTPSRFLIPDVAVVAQLQFPYPAQAPELCLEILSPDDAMQATLDKCQEYHAWGVPTCWVIDPVKQKAWQCSAVSEAQLATGTLHSGGLSLEINELFSALPN